ncbi:yhhN-like family protein, partial [Vibrio parahaemolyticus EKP-021]
MAILRIKAIACTCDD